MKRFYLPVIASAVMISASAAEFDFGPLAGNKTERPSFSMKGGQSKRLNSPKRSAAQPDGQYITETPAGTEVQYMRSGHAVAYIWGYLVNTSADGYVCSVVRDDAGNIYIKPAFSQYVTDGWLAGTVKDGVATFDLPQTIGYDEEMMDNFYALKVTYDADAKTMVPTEDQTYRLSINSDGTITSLQDENDELGLCDYFAGIGGAEGSYSWQGFADSFASMKPVDMKIAGIPSDVKLEDWYLIDGVTASTVRTGIADGKVYVKGLSSQVPDGVYIGTIDTAAGTATFPSGQYQGISAEDYRAGFIIAAKQEYDYLTDWFTYVYAPEAVFKYDSEAMTLELDGSILFTSTPDKLEDNNYFDYIDNPYIKYQAPGTKVTSIDPAIIMNSETGTFTMIGFIMPVVTESGVILDPSRLYYQVMVDDSPMTFSPEAYNDIEEETTEIPYGYNTGYNGNFFTEGSEHMLVVYAEGYTSLGIRLVYRAGEDDAIYSAIAYVPGFESGIGTVGNDSMVRTETFYDLQGREVSNPAAGFYIRRTTFADGSTHSCKVMLR